MAQQNSLVSGITIDNPSVTITYAPDGSMLLSDNFVSIKLKDIIAGSVVVDPSVIVEVSSSEWTVDPVTTLYAIDIPHNFGLVGIQLAQFLTIIYDSNFKQIMVDRIEVQSNYVYILSTSPLNMYVTMKRL
jgi:hypothetical protein